MKEQCHIDDAVVEEIPRGYPAIAAFKSSDRNFLQFRGFNYLHCRVLSDLQHGIELLEEELDDLDQHDHGSNQRRLQSRLDDLEQSTEDPTASMYPEEIVRNRPEVLTELKMKLLEYGMSNYQAQDLPTNHYRYCSFEDQGNGLTTATCVAGLSDHEELVRVS